MKPVLMLGAVLCALTLWALGQPETQAQDAAQCSGQATAVEANCSGTAAVEVRGRVLLLQRLADLRAQRHAIRHARRTARAGCGG